MSGLEKWRSNPRIPRAMFRKTTLPLLLLAGLLAAVAEKERSADATPAFPGTKESPAKKVGWVETEKLHLHGWTVHADKQLVSGDAKALGARALSMLANHLERLTILMPEKQLGELRKLEIFIEHSHPELGNMQYHPDADWLIERGYDPRLAKKVHIPQAGELVSRAQMLKHPAVILHELAHSYHDQVLGFEDPTIIAAYNEAMKKGIYEKSLLYNGDTVKHYATTNHKEYFAECTEAYLYHNDFYPFVRAELHTHDSTAFRLMESVWGKTK